MFIVGYNIFITSFLMLVIKYVFRVPLRMSEDKLLVGDDAVHGEDAYCFSDYPETVDTPGRAQDLEVGTPVPAKDSTNGAEAGGKQD